MTVLANIAGTHVRVREIQHWDKALLAPGGGDACNVPVLSLLERETGAVLHLSAIPVIPIPISYSYSSPKQNIIDKLFPRSKISLDITKTY